MASVRPGGENRFASRSRSASARRARERARGGSSSDNNNRRTTASSRSSSPAASRTAQPPQNGGGREDRRSASRRRAGAVYGAREPDRRDSGYGFNVDEEIAGPAVPAASERFDIWARDVLDREGPPERKELDTLSEGLDAHERYQTGQFVSTLAGAVNPLAGLGVRAAEEIYSQQQSPEYQAARDVSQGASPLSEKLGVAGDVLGFVSPGLSAAGGLINPGATVVEADRGLFSEIRTFTGRDRAKGAFPSGGESDDRDTTIRPPLGLPGQGVPGTMAGQFQAPSDFKYSTFLDKFTAG